MLKDVSQIKISGGCEVFAEGGITFVPLDKGKTIVKIDNSGHYFYDENSEPIPSFKIKVHTEQLSGFIKNWFELMDSVKKTENVSTRDAVIEFDFSLTNRQVHASYSENQDGYQLDPLINSIEAFVKTCYAKAKPSQSKPKFSPINQTEEFLGSPDYRNKIVLQFNDMSGMHGGRLIVVTGAGNVIVQLISHNSEKNTMWEKRYSFDISSTQLEEILSTIIKNDALTIQLEDRPGVPDEVRFHFSITNANNEFFQLETWERSSLFPDDYQNSPRAKFDDACLGLKQLEHMARTEKTPAQEGPYVRP